MLSIPLALALVFPIAQDEDKPVPPSKEVVKAAIERIEEAFAKETPDEIAASIQQLELLPHEDVIDALVDAGLTHKERDVVGASIQVLGMVKHDDALDALHGYYKKHKKNFKRDYEQGALLLRSIALHENPDSIELLDDDVFEVKSTDLARARIYGLGRIRTNASLETLMGLLKKTDRRKVKNRMNDLRLALIILTHQDHGADQDAWVAWWNDNKKTFAVPGEMPRLTEELANRWGRYWGEPRQYERQKRRGERGDDPEKDGDGGKGGRDKDA
ncbi:MAG: hypothetical protein O2816_13670 [Planctomycetota bacterium]|nr:hypothetical protein [Planctomycetota bacterium]